MERSSSGEAALPLQGSILYGTIAGSIGVITSIQSTKFYNTLLVSLVTTTD